LLSQKVINYLLGISIFLLPIWQVGSIIFWAITILATLKENSIFQIKDRLVKQPLFLLFIIFYLLHIVGLLWTSNYTLGFSYLQVSVTLLLFPILFLLIKLDGNTNRYISTGFISGLVVLTLFYLIRAYFNYRISLDIDEFFYTQISVFSHPTYLTMEVNLAIIIILNELFEKNYKLSFFTKLGFCVLILYFISISILLASKTAMFAVFITILFYLVMALVKSNKFKSFGWVLFISCVVISFPAIKIIKSTDRYIQLENAVHDFKNLDISSIKGEKLNSSTERIAFWVGGLHVFKDNWKLGVGTGDLKSSCIEEYKRLNFEYGVKEFNNMHCQYLQTGIMLGIPGLLLLILMWFYPIFKSLFRREILYASFLLIIIINALTASLLTASGVLFYAFFNAFYCRFYLYADSK